MNPDRNSPQQPANRGQQGQPPFDRNASPTSPSDRGNSAVEHCDVSIAPEQPADAAQQTSPGGKLDTAGKRMLCEYVAKGNSIASAARLVGVSERAVYYAKNRDPVFKRQLLMSKEDTAAACFHALRTAIEDPKQWRASFSLMQLVYPERCERTTPAAEKKSQKFLEEFLRLLFPILTEDQMQEVNRLLKSCKQE